MVDFNELIGELELKIALMDEADLKGELDDEEFDELDKLKKDLIILLEDKEQL